MEITRTSVFTGKTQTKEIPCTPEQYDAWQGGKLIQQAMPDVSPDDREFLMTGCDEAEWNTLFGEA